MRELTRVLLSQPLGMHGFVFILYFYFKIKTNINSNIASFKKE